MTGETDKLARWSRAKAEAGAASTAVASGDEAVCLDEEALAALPKLEDIDAGADIRGFLREGVPLALRAAALSRAWLADPAIRDRVPDAIDYAEDYNAPHTIAGWGPACPREASGAATRAHAPLREASRSDEKHADDTRETEIRRRRRAPATIRRVAPGRIGRGRRAVPRVRPAALRSPPATIDGAPSSAPLPSASRKFVLVTGRRCLSSIEGTIAAPYSR
ncbi:MAG: DUF3306 domain-containing protein [Rhodoblastus sp.]|nr:MAG: DUF3306 domain-containing protein [Rhodoblastus sp.]